MQNNNKVNIKDSELVIAARSGNIWAYTELVKRHQKGLKAELLTLLRNAHDAEDLTQETLLRAFLKIQSLNSPYDFGAWIRKIARNKALNFLARGLRFISIDEENIQDQNRDSRSLSEDEIIKRIENVMRALSGLSTPLRETSRLFYLCDYSHKQVADRLRIPLGTVKRRLWESRLQMKKEVAKMSVKGRIAEPQTMVPKIVIEEIPDRKMEIKSKGPGLFFSTRLDEGHIEECKFFDYPQGILTGSARTTVVRNVSVFGKKCYEVLVENSESEPPEPNVLDYFEETEQGFKLLMEVTADPLYPQTRFIEEEEFFFRKIFISGEHEDFIGNVVNLTIGEKKWGECLVVWWGWDDGTPAQSFYTAEGRQVLHRRFVGPDAPPSKNYDYVRLGEESIKLFKGKEYRLWYDCVIV